MNRKKFLKRYTIILMICISGCVSDITPEAEGLPPTQTIMATYSAIPSVTSKQERKTLKAPPTPTPNPTMTNKQIKTVVNLANLEECTLPCFMGITPGVTTIDEGRKLIQSFTIFRNTGYIRSSDGAKYYAYLFFLGLPTISDSETGYEKEFNGVFHFLDLITNSEMVGNNEKVEIIEFGVDIPIKAKERQQDFDMFWGRYDSVSKIFHQLGQPEYIYIDNYDPNYEPYTLGRTMILGYPSKGIKVEITGNSQDNNICTNFRASLFNLSFLLFNTNTKLDTSADESSLSNCQCWLPLEEVLGINNQMFYQKVLEEPTKCFEPVNNP